jgi:hypothetical protein
MDMLRNGASTQKEANRLDGTLTLGSLTSGVPTHQARACRRATNLVARVRIPWH